jgi:hypothetical protein
VASIERPPETLLDLLSIMHFYSTGLLCLAALTPFAVVQADSTVFSQFIGATTASGPSSGDLATSFTLCTNFLHGLPVLTNLASSLSTQLEQVAVDGVCQICTSIGQSRIDSCCGQATSSACFDQFAGSNAAQTAPASVSATPTATSAGGLSSTPSSSSNGGIIAKVRPQYMVVIDADPFRTRTSSPVPL